MGETTKIQWADHTFNPWVGCAKVSEGCKHCYAEHGTTARVSRSRGLPLWGVDAGRHVTSDANWKQPIRWNRAADAAGERRRVFCASMADVFEDRADLREPRARLYQLINDTPSLDWLLLTKRPEHAARLWGDALVDALGPHGEDVGDASPWLPNIWLGTTCEDQARYDERWPILGSIPARVHFVSHEPAIGPLTLLCGGCGEDVAVHLAPDQGGCPACFPDWVITGCPACFPDWVITGGESGLKARAYSTEWARSLIRQTIGTRISVFVKQLGANPGDPTGDGELAPLVFRDQKGGDWDEWPDAALRVRELPTPRTR